MKRSPIILVTPSTDGKGEEFDDASISLSYRYTEAIIAAGGLPQIFPPTTSRAVAAEAVRRCDGVLMTGGNDINPKLYDPNLPEALEKTVGALEPDRDVWEKEIVAEIMAQRKPLFGICRGHQMLNVALGGTLIVDIPSQVPNHLKHSRMDCKNEPVHDVKIAPDSLLAELVGQENLAVNSTHHQAIGRLAPELRAVAQSADGVIEAVELKNDADRPFLLGVQFHPERLIDRYAVFLQVFSGFIEACASWRDKNL